VLALVLAACPEPKPPARRAEIRKISPTTVQIVPTQGQLPYCLVFTIAAKGVIRQLTMSRENQSFQCPADAPIGGVTYRFPINEGRVRIYILFSDQKLSANSVAGQIVEKSTAAILPVTDLRLPGRATAEVLEFLPGAEVEPTVGRLLGPQAESLDGSNPVASDGGR
jgi:hypothetical protein